MSGLDFWTFTMQGLFVLCMAALALATYPKRNRRP